MGPRRRGAEGLGVASNSADGAVGLCAGAGSGSGVDSGKGSGSGVDSGKGSELSSAAGIDGGSITSIEEVSSGVCSAVATAVVVTAARI